MEQWQMEQQKQAGTVIMMEVLLHSPSIEEACRQLNSHLMKGLYYYHSDDIDDECESYTFPVSAWEGVQQWAVIANKAGLIVKLKVLDDGEGCQIEHGSLR